MNTDLEISGLMTETVIDDSVIQGAMREFAEKRDRFMRRTLAEHDWDLYPILDFVWIGDDDSLAVSHGNNLPDALAETFTQKVIVRQWKHPAPPLEDAAVEDHRCEIQRVTRPLWEKLQREHAESLREPAP